MAHRKRKPRTGEEEETAKAPPIEHGEVTEENPSGIVAVSDEHAMRLGELRGHGGPGAAGATVAGPAVHVATEGGTKPLPVRNPEPTEEEAAGEEEQTETTE